MSAGVGPNSACSRNRAAVRFGVPRPGPGFGGPTMFTAAVPFEDALATLVACTVTVAGFGIEDGAVYRPAAVMVPTAALPPATPFTLQVTAVLAALVTVAVNA